MSIQDAVESLSLTYQGSDKFLSKINIVTNIVLIVLLVGTKASANAFIQAANSSNTGFFAKQTLCKFELRWHITDTWNEHEKKQHWDAEEVIHLRGEQDMKFCPHCHVCMLSPNEAASRLQSVIETMDKAAAEMLSIIEQMHNCSTLTFCQLAQKLNVQYDKKFENCCKDRCKCKK